MPDHEGTNRGRVGPTMAPQVVRGDHLQCCKWSGGTSCGCREWSGGTNFGGTSRSMTDHGKVVFEFYINDMKMVSGQQRLYTFEVWRLCVIRSKYFNCTVNPSKDRTRFKTAPMHTLLPFVIFFKIYDPFWNILRRYTSIVTVKHA